MQQERKKKINNTCENEKQIASIKTFNMSTIKFIEVIGFSEKSFDEAVMHCVKKLSKTIHNIDSVFIKEFKIHVRKNKPVSYEIVCNISFRIDTVNR
jgi:flavin-binding protein dodecin